MRELRNAIEKLSVLADGPTITVEDVESYAVASGAPVVAPLSRPLGSEPASGRLDDAERQIRELRAAVEELRGLIGIPAAEETAPASGAEAGTGSGSYHDQMEAASRVIVLRALEEAGSITGAARILGLSRQNLSIKCKQLGLARG